jgi:hypothetical protein
MKAIVSSETSVETRQITRRHIPEDDTLHKEDGLTCCIAASDFHPGDSQLESRFETPTILTEGFRCSAQFPGANSGLVIRNRLRPLSSTSSIIHHWLIILPFDAMLPEVLTAS